jgi:hypothetical protein
MNGVEQPPYPPEFNFVGYICNKLEYACRTGNIRVLTALVSIITADEFGPILTFERYMNCGTIAIVQGHWNIIDYLTTQFDLVVVCQSEFNRSTCLHGWLKSAVRWYKRCGAEMFNAITRQCDKNNINIIAEQTAVLINSRINGNLSGEIEEVRRITMPALCILISALRSSVMQRSDLVSSFAYVPIGPLYELFNTIDMESLHVLMVNFALDNVRMPTRDPFGWNGPRGEYSARITAYHANRVAVLELICRYLAGVMGELVFLYAGVPNSF